MDVSEGIWCVRIGTPSYSQDSVAGAFNRLFLEFAEVRQPAYTRRQLRYTDGAPEVDVVSRLDGVWANAPTPLLQFASWARGRCTIGHAERPCGCLDSLALGSSSAQECVATVGC